MIKTLTKAALCALALLAALPVDGQPLAGTWSSNGPEGASSPDLVVDRSNPSILYEASSAGLFKSIDGGGRWLRIASPGAFALNHSRPNELLLLDGLGLRRSTDGGATWARLAGPADGPHYFYDVTFEANSPDVILLLENVLDTRNHSCYPFTTVIYQSRDDGKTWTPVDAFGPYCQLYIRYAARFVTDEAAVWAIDLLGYLHKVSNRVFPVVPPTLPPVNAVASDPRDPLGVYAAMKSGVMRSDDGGATWSQTAMNLEVTSLLVNGIGEVFARSATLWWFSENRGATWLPFTGSLELVAVDLSNPLVLYGSVGTQLVKTTDRGLKWQPIDDGLRANSISAIAIDPLRAGRAYAVAGPDLFRTDDGGANWSKRGTIWPRRIKALAVEPSSGKLYATNDAGEALGSSDGGATWRLLLPGSPFFRSLALAPSSPGTVYFIQSSGPPYRTSDGGETASVVPGVSDVDAVAVDPRDSSVVYAYDGSLKKSTDGGATWAQLSLPGSGGTTPTLVIDPADSRNLYFWNTFTFLRSFDAGLTWAPADRYLSVTSLVVHPSRSGELFGIQSGGVLRSSDYGRSWRVLPESPWSPSALAIDPSEDKLYAGTVSGVFTYSPLAPRASHRVRPVTFH